MSTSQGDSVAEAAFDLSRTAFAICPEAGCGKTGTPRGIKHHYTTVHAKGQKGTLAIAYAAVSKKELVKLQESA